MAHLIELTSSKRMVTSIVSSHSMLDSLEGCKVEGMRRAYTTSLLDTPSVQATHNIPAPTMTLETPLHIDL